jgi:dipeptidase E
MRNCGSVWVAGGNIFVLRRVMQDSGFDRIMTDMLGEYAIVYAGYSAGICVLAQSLRGLELVDDPAEVEQTFQKEVILDGLGLLPYTPVPHFQSQHVESEKVNAVVSFLKSEGVPYKTLRQKLGGTPSPGVPLSRSPRGCTPGGTPPFGYK